MAIVLLLAYRDATSTGLDPQLVTEIQADIATIYSPAQSRDEVNVSSQGIKKSD